MNKLFFDHSGKTVVAQLGISDERAEELNKLADHSIWELQEPKREGFTDVELLEAVCKHAKNEQELMFQAFVAGMYLEGVSPTTEHDEYEEEYEDYEDD